MEKSKIKEKSRNEGKVQGKLLKDGVKKLINLKSEMKKAFGVIVKKTNINTDSATLKAYTQYAVYAVFGFLMSVVMLPQRIKPLGISAICASSDKNCALFTYIGVAAGCITYGKEALSSFIIYFMLYAVRKTFTESKFKENIFIKMLEASSASAAIGIIRICTASEAPLYSYIAFVTSCCIAVSYTYFFGVLFDKREYKSAKMSTVSICSYALMAAIVCAFGAFTVPGLNLQIVIACLITLSYAVINGFLHSGSVGFICGIACASPVISACLGLSGIVSSLLLSKSIIAAIVSFAAVFFSVAAYSAGLGTAAALLPSVLCGCILFFPVCGFLPESFRLSTKAVKSENKGCCCGITSNEGKKLADAFFSVSDMFSKLGEKQKYPSLSDIETIVDKSFCQVCEGCALSEMCFAKRKTDMDELKQTLFAVLNTRDVRKEDFGSHMNDKCIRLEKHIDVINRCHRELVNIKASDNRPFLLGAQYAGMARIINDADKRLAVTNERDTVFEKKLSDALKSADIPFSSIYTANVREKNTVVHGISLDRIPFGANELRKYLYAKLAVRITEPSFDISEKNDYVMSFTRANAYRFEYAQITKSAKNDDVNGDTVNFIDGKNGYFRAIICDGMGSGKEAAVSSRLASLFLEKMLDTNTEKGVILELLGNALMSRSCESFSTVDLFEADLITGKSVFVKAGAAPSYVIRTGKLYKIFSATPPVGIIPGFTSEMTRFNIEPEDVIIMISDGAVQNNEDSAFIAELIKTDTSKDASAIAGEISEKCEEMAERNDDISICVIKAKAENQ